MVSHRSLRKAEERPPLRSRPRRREWVTRRFCDIIGHNDVNLGGVTPESSVMHMSDFIRRIIVTAAEIYVLTRNRHPAERVDSKPSLRLCSKLPVLRKMTPWNANPIPVT